MHGLVILSERDQRVADLLIGVVSERFLGGTTIPQTRAVIFPIFPLGGRGVVGISMKIHITVLNWKQIAVRH